MFLIDKKASICLWTLILLSHILSPVAIKAQHIVKNAEELITLLREDKNQGVILLDGVLFPIANLEVKAGGVIKPYPGRKPVFIGFHQKVSREGRSLDKNGYWNVPIKGYGSTQIVFLDDKFEAIPYSCHLNGEDGFEIKARDIQRVNEANRIVRIPIPVSFGYLKNRDKNYFKNFSIKLSYWFVGMELWQIYSDDEYIYGRVDNNYNFNLLSVRPYATVYLKFFNLPIDGDGIFLDGNDVLHVPSQYNTVSVCTTPPILKLIGDRSIAFEGITVTGANNEAVVVLGSNKHFKNCVFRNNGKGIVTDDTGAYTNCSIKCCLFENLYNNRAISLSGINAVTVEDNIIRQTGTLMKGGSVISVAGLGFKVINNNISGFSYNAISVGNTRDYRPETITGVVRNNIVDNQANYGKANNQLDDGGGIYVITHTDGVEISNNIVRNIGYEDAWMHGIYLDDGAYNVTVKNNLVYNICPSSKAIYSRYVEEIERSCINNTFEGNICIGDCVMAGNENGAGGATVITGNYISGEIENVNEDYINLVNNHKIDVEVLGNNVVKIKNKIGLKTCRYSKAIRKLIK